MSRPEGGSGSHLRWIGARSLPECLRGLSHPPAGLWCLGRAEALAGAPDRHVAIVGTREASPYGLRIAERLAAACARAGLVVVSGMARGVDAAAHVAALAAGGSTIAVQGTGVDVPYPVGHRTLHRRLVEAATVVSEMEPGTGASPGCFPRRNRLIAALCRVTVVVEAGFKSGAINTATQSLNLGRTVAAVPGRIDEERAAGANLLIRDGAQVVTCVEDLLALFDLSTLTAARTGAGEAEVETTGLSGGGPPSVRALVESGRFDATTISEARPSTPLRQVASDLLKLELAGQLRRDHDGYQVQS